MSSTTSPTGFQGLGEQGETKQTFSTVKSNKHGNVATHTHVMQRPCCCPSNKSEAARKDHQQ
jgi:hypothetical protein